MMKKPRPEIKDRWLASSRTRIYQALLCWRSRHFQKTNTDVTLKWKRRNRCAASRLVTTIPPPPGVGKRFLCSLSSCPCRCPISAETHRILIIFSKKSVPRTCHLVVQGLEICPPILGSGLIPGWRTKISYFCGNCWICATTRGSISESACSNSDSQPQWKTLKNKICFLHHSHHHCICTAQTWDSITVTFSLSPPYSSCLFHSGTSFHFSTPSFPLHFYKVTTQTWPITSIRDQL